MKFPVEFETQERKDSYVISANVRGLLEEDIRIEMGRDQVLYVSIFKGPSHRDENFLQGFIKNTRGFPPDGEDDVPPEIWRVCCGRFGASEGGFNLPADVDTEGLQSSYRDGTLNIVLPKKALPKNKKHQAHLPMPLSDDPDEYKTTRQSRGFREPEFWW